MAKVYAKVAGGDPKSIECETLKCVKEQMSATGYTATVNGEPESDNYQLQNDDFVVLAQPVKAGI